ncbi:hemicentin-1 [Aplysia californica]|uniref:Hemicentin-1 n=1 Tax=Aplysia californica TaxID=6500 RepID=A0ABM0ZV87_APLCA|nr:hemicentin-1 [Aplysia californica]
MMRPSCALGALLTLMALVATGDAQLPQPKFVFLTNNPPYVLLGSGVSLLCNSTTISLSFGDTIYRFFKDSTEVARQEWQTYFIPQSTVDDSGVWTCTVEQAGQTSPPSPGESLWIVGAPVLSMTPTTVGVGDSVTFTCQFDAGSRPTGLSYAFYRQNTRLDGSSNTLSISSLQVVNEGNYVCKVTFTGSQFESAESNQLGITFSPPLKPTLTSANASVKVGDIVIFKCKADSNKLAGIVSSSLYQNGNMIMSFSTGSDEASFSGNAFSADAGGYTCTFSNTFGESPQSEVLGLTVQDWTPSTPSDFGNTISRLMAAEQPNVVQCPVNQKENEDFCTLYVGGQRYLQSGQCRFTMKQGVTGDYSCSASNANNESPQNLKKSIRFVDKPRIVVVTTYYPQKGRSFTLRCLVGTTDNIFFRWYPETSETSPVGAKQDLVFSVVDDGTQKRYRCVVREPNSNDLVWSDYFYLQYSTVPTPSLTERRTTKNQFQKTASSVMNCYSKYASKGYSLYQDSVMLGDNPAFQGTFNVFTSLKKGHSYSCEASTLFKTSNMSDTTYLPGANEITLQASPAKATVGQRLELTCNFDNPRNEELLYTFVIYRDVPEGMTKMETRTDGATLIFDPVTAGDAGLYSCQVEFRGMTFTGYQTYVMQFTPLPPPTVTSFISSAVDGQSSALTVDLTCTVRGVFYNSENKIRLYKDGSPIRTVPYEETSGFFNYFQVDRKYMIDASRSENYGTYTCTAVNSYGESVQSEEVIVQPTTLKAARKPTISANGNAPDLGSSLTLTCNTPAGVDSSTVIWNKDFYPILQTGGSLTFSSLTAEDNGYYQCSYPDDSQTGRQTSDSYVLPLMTPLVPELTFSRDAEGNSFRADDGDVYQMFAEGQDVFVKCWAGFQNIDSITSMKYPVPGRTYSFFNGDQQVSSGNPGGIVKLPALSKGTYNFTCQVNDRVGNSPSSWPLEVRIVDAPTITTDKNPLPDVTLNYVRIYLTCQTTQSSDGSDIIWEKNGIELSSNAVTMVLRRINKYHEGSYTCRQKQGRWSSPPSPALTLTPTGGASTPEIFTIQSPSLEAGMTLTLYCLGASSTSTEAILYFDRTKTENYLEVDRSTEFKLDSIGQIRFMFTIKAVSDVNDGHYSCTMRNGRGESAKADAIPITVVVPDDSNKCSPNPCQENQVCVSTSVGFRCDCVSGYTRQGINCVDINECQSGNQCPNNRQCRNTPGSFQCLCLDGSQPDNNNNCPGDTTTTCADNPCEQNQQCVDQNSGFACNCLLGYMTGAVGCVDINECQQSPCGANARCDNNLGSYTCSCLQGYQGNANTGCVDINECQQSPCGENARCNNSLGSYTCSCLQGYQDDANTGCVDINECQQSPCGANASCNNNLGSYTCSCLQGYQGDANTGCVDINECQFSNQCPNNRQCRNTAGSFQCLCLDGSQPDNINNCPAAITLTLTLPNYKLSEEQTQPGTAANNKIIEELKDATDNAYGEVIKASTLLTDVNVTVNQDQEKPTITINNQSKKRMCPPFTARQSRYPYRAAVSAGDPSTSGRPALQQVQDDNATPHRSRAANAFVQQAGITRMVRPANSPDLNPIEQL